MITTRKDRPRGVVVTEYSELRRYATNFAAGKFHLLILVGGPGLGKSQTFHRAVGNDAMWIAGSASAYGMFKLLANHRDQLVVLDDVDSLLRDREVVRLLKSLCQSDPIKTISWHTAKAGAGREAPAQFQTSSRVAIIANEITNLSPDARAVLDRGIVIRFEPSSLEIHNEVAQWFEDQIVFDWIGDHLPLFHNLSMRHYLHAAELRSATMDWQTYLFNLALDEKLLPAAKVLDDPSFGTESERIAAYQELGGGARSTYYNHTKQLRGVAEGAAPRMLLPNAQAQPASPLIVKPR